MAKDEKTDGISTDDLIKDYRAKLSEKIKSGETKNISSEIAQLIEIEREQEREDEDPEKALAEDTETEDEIGIPERLRIKRPYHMSEAAIKQRKDRRSKGGKARAKKCPTPNWRHGTYATSSVTATKPCKTTCKKYPCELIAENKVKPGETCLDMVFVLQTFKAINKAIKKKDYDEFNEIAAFSISQSVEILRMCQEDIIRDGPMIKVEKFDGFGRVIGYDYKPHPSLLVVPKLIAELGMTPQESMITARQIAKDGNEKELPKTLADLLCSVPDLKKA
jgi:hypothetical protein